ncbi:MAG TPA: hypothetical protein VHH88_11035 [Verrucomicrobiae bacterium]|nr:hypothetical protein [Verrucomicrobiae bacterium]
MVQFPAALYVARERKSPAMVPAVMRGTKSGEKNGKRTLAGTGQVQLWQGITPLKSTIFGLMLSAMQKKPPRDPSQLGKFIVDAATGQEPDGAPDEREKDPAAVELGKRGGKARAAKMSAKKRSEIARQAAKSRWKRK